MDLIRIRRISYKIEEKKDVALLTTMTSHDNDFSFVFAAHRKYILNLAEVDTYAYIKSLLIITDLVVVR